MAAGLPAFTIGGLPDSAVRESRERVRTAIRNAGFAFPSDRITVNLAPADLRKEGASFDLPIALGILAATGVLRAGGLGPFAVVGELALDGQIQPVRGTLAVGLACRRRGIGTLLVPARQLRRGHRGDEPARAAGRHAARRRGACSTATSPAASAPRPDGVAAGGRRRARLRRRPRAGARQARARDRRGRRAQRAAGGAVRAPARRCWRDGSPRSCRRSTTTRSSRSRRSGRWPACSAPRSGLMTRAAVPRAASHDLRLGARRRRQSAASRRGDARPPRRALPRRAAGVPAARARVAASTAGGRPGRGRARARASATSRRASSSIAAANPCRRGCPTLEACICTPAERNRYLGRLSRPLLDRIDLQVELPALAADEFERRAPSDGSAGDPRARAGGARASSAARCADGGIALERRAHAASAPTAVSARAGGRARCSAAAMTRLGLSARGHDRALRVARTIADLAGAETIAAEHCAEAVQYRGLDRAWRALRPDRQKRARGVASRSGSMSGRS